MREALKQIGDLVRLTIRKILCLLPVRKIIVFESSPDYSCNTYPVFLELKNRLRKNEYKLVWFTSRKTPKIEGTDDVYFYDDMSYKNQLKTIYYENISSFFVISNKVIQKHRKDHSVLFLGHGSKTKKTKGCYEVGQYVDYVNIQSHFFDEVTMYEYNTQNSQLVYLGYPRCDCFYKKLDINDKLKSMGVNGKYVVWLPTFRKNQRGSRNVHSESYEKIGMPIIYSVETLKAMDDYLQEINLYLLFKPHPVQDTSSLKSIELKRIFVISDSLLMNKDLRLYEVLAKSSALITDYSSVFYDYLLLDRPIATTIDDIDAWKNGRGFAFDLESIYKKSTSVINDFSDLKIFLGNVCEGVDVMQEGREEIKLQTNMYCDGNSAERVANFVIKQIRKD